MAVITTTFQNTAAFQSALNAAVAAGATLDVALTDGGNAFSEFDTGVPTVTSQSPTQLVGSISGGGTFVIDGSNLDSPSATITHLLYADNSPAAVLELFGNITITESSETGTITRVLYDSESIDFDLQGSIDIQNLSAGLVTFSLTSFSIHITGPTDVRISFSGAINASDASLSGTVTAVSLAVDGQSIVATGLNLSAAVLDSFDAVFIMSSLLSGDDIITGQGLDQTLEGFSGNDTLSAGTGNDTLLGGLGNDSMIGGLGDDTYMVDNAGDIVTENANEGTDTVISSLSYTLGNDLEKLVLSGTADLNGTGNALSNALTGNSGNNLLDGGTGADNLIGGAGNDTYVINTSRDRVVETFNNGIDSIQANIPIFNRVSFLGKKIPSQFAPGPTLATPDNVENLSVLGFTRANLIGTATHSFQSSVTRSRTSRTKASRAMRAASRLAMAASTPDAADSPAPGCAISTSMARLSFTWPTLLSRRKTTCGI